MDIKAQRKKMGISQLRLARLANVGRYKLWLHESGDTELSQEEQARIRAAFRREANRLRTIAEQVTTRRR